MWYNYSNRIQIVGKVSREMKKCISCFQECESKVLDICMSCRNEMDSEEVRLVYKVYYSKLYNSPKEDRH